MKKTGQHRSARRSRTSTAAVLYEDNDILIADKPAGISTTAGRSDTRRSLHDTVLDHVRSNSDTAMRVRPINLLEPAVSGLVVFAKSKRMESALESVFRRNRVKRTYTALVEGTFDAGEGSTGTVQSSEDTRGSRAKRRDAASAQLTPAVTHYRVIRQSEDTALVQLRPETHRKGQLLQHMRQIGHPVIGDETGPVRHRQLPLMLHLEQIAFEHPRLARDVRVTAPRPSVFAQSLGGPVRDKQSLPTDLLSTSWQPVAEWYSDYHATAKSDHFTDVIHPRSLRLLGDVRGRRMLDVACGEGTFASLLTERGAAVTGVDAAPDLIDAANARRLHGATFVMGDANRLDDAGDVLQGPFDAAACIMALMNIADLDATLRGLAARLAPGSPFVAAVIHPAFRSPKRTSWGWDTTDTGSPRQYRRVDAYLSESREPITMNPGQAAHGKPPVTTYTFHRPISGYVSALVSAGFAVEALDEWTSARVSEPGPRADEENRARAEFPLFLGIRAVRTGRMS